MKAIYHLGFRQTEGFLQSVAKLLGVTIDIPDYSTLSRRQKTLVVPLATSSPRQPVHVVVDSTGVKVFGEGEWKVRQHGASKRRTWRKLHVAVNEATGEALAVELTTNSVDDAAEVKLLLAQISTPVSAFSGDGSYDKNKVYKTLAEHAQRQQSAIQINIPPRKDAKIIQHGNSAQVPLARDENLRAIREYGRQCWKEQCGYHRRSLVENFMFRFKTIVGPKFKSRTFEAQQIEVRIGCMILNRMAALDMPDSFKKVLDFYQNRPSSLFCKIHATKPFHDENNKTLAGQKGLVSKRNCRHRIVLLFLKMIQATILAPFLERFHKIF